MVYFVYILYSEKDGKLYVGCTSDLVRRLERHNNGYILATKNRRPLTIIHKEDYKNKSEAFQRERFLKSLWGGKIKRKILKDFLLSQDFNKAKPSLARSPDLGTKSPKV